MKVLIIFLTLCLWTETPQAAVIKQDELFMKHEINLADDLFNLRHQNEGKRQNAKIVAQKEGTALNETDFKDAKFVDTRSANYEAILKASLFEGDIAGVNLSAIESLGKNAVLDPQRWPNGIIPYVIANHFNRKWRAQIAKAMDEYHRKTCIRFVKKTRAHRDFVNIVDNGVCHSQIGRVGGGQRLSLGRTCFGLGIIIHEFMHAVGFWHEQSRADRDKYVRILTENIQKGMAYNFRKISWKYIQNLGAAYDFGSLMHYGPYEFSRFKNRPTIVSRVPGKKFGQRKGFSKIDLMKINKLYKCQMHKTSKCKDVDKQCAEFATQGQCKTNPVYMSFFCIKACGLCSN